MIHLSLVSRRFCRTTLSVVEAWFTSSPKQQLRGSRCTRCGTVAFPAEQRYCTDPSCDGDTFESYAFSRTGVVWSYTDAQYQPPPPYLPPPDGHRPFGIAAVELPEGVVVLGQLAEGCTVDDVHVGSEVELVVEPLYADESGVRTTWRWRPVASAQAQAPAVSAP